MTHSHPSPAPPDDPNLWLEAVTGDEALAWVREHNDKTVAAFAGTTAFEQLESKIRSILDTDVRIPYARRRGKYLYNFWRDAEHVRGLWRRTTMDEYRSDAPEWEVLVEVDVDVDVDVDDLAEREDENWVWSGAQVRRPEQDVALISLSRGGICRHRAQIGALVEELGVDLEWSLIDEPIAVEHREYRVTFRTGELVRRLPALGRWGRCRRTGLVACGGRTCHRGQCRCSPCGDPGGGQFVMGVDQRLLRGSSVSALSEICSQSACAFP